ncbi:hypothetical protein ACIQUL_34270 [Streptomyces sp. NPDC090303]|uniref:hypothetical protein n=1 Tax=Streptomyces sp. NPDC090303 TaxID=3365960 RepID=UPI00381FD7B7
MLSWLAVAAEGNWDDAALAACVEMGWPGCDSEQLQAYVTDVFASRPGRGASEVIADFAPSATAGLLDLNEIALASRDWKWLQYVAFEWWGEAVAAFEAVTHRVVTPQELYAVVHAMHPVSPNVPETAGYLYVEALFGNMSSEILDAALQHVFVPAGQTAHAAASPGAGKVEDILNRITRNVGGATLPEPGPQLLTAFSGDSSALMHIKEAFWAYSVGSLIAAEWPAGLTPEETRAAVPLLVERVEKSTPGENTVFGQDFKTGSHPPELTLVVHHLQQAWGVVQALGYRDVQRAGYKRVFNHTKGYSITSAHAVELMLAPAAEEKDWFTQVTPGQMIQEIFGRETDVHPFPAISKKFQNWGQVPLRNEMLQEEIATYDENQIDSCAEQILYRIMQSAVCAADFDRARQWLAHWSERDGGQDLEAALALLVGRRAADVRRSLDEGP